LSRSHASWSASSASVAEPSIRYATECRCARCAWNRSARKSSFIGHILPSGYVIAVDRPNAVHVTEHEECIHMSEGVKTIIYPVGDLAAAKARFSELLGAEPTSDSPYYVGFSVGGQDIGLDPHGHK